MYYYSCEMKHTACESTARYQQIAVHAELQDYNFHTLYLLNMRDKKHNGA